MSLFTSKSVKQKFHKFDPHTCFAFQLFQYETEPFTENHNISQRNLQMFRNWLTALTEYLLTKYCGYNFSTYRRCPIWLCRYTNNLQTAKIYFLTARENHLVEHIFLKVFLNICSYVSCGVLCQNRCTTNEKSGRHTVTEVRFSAKLQNVHFRLAYHDQLQFDVIFLTDCDFLQRTILKSIHLFFSRM